MAGERHGGEKTELTFKMTSDGLVVVSRRGRPFHAKNPRIANDLLAYRRLPNPSCRQMRGISIHPSLLSLQEQN